MKTEKQKRDEGHEPLPDSIKVDFVLDETSSIFSQAWPPEQI